jgi:hypothetical protein
MPKIYPTKASALNVHHPLAGAPRLEGVDWPYDAFTCSRLTDGSFTEDETKAYKPPPASAEVAKPAAPTRDEAREANLGGPKFPPAKND